MKNLKITTRLAISIAFLLAALLFLVHAYYRASQKEMHALRLELQGVEFLTQLTKTAEAVSRYRISLVRENAGEHGFQGATAEEQGAAHAQVEALLERYAANEEPLGFADTYLQLRHRADISAGELERLWKEASQAGYGESVRADYDELFRRMSLLVEHVAETSGLVADEDLASNALITAITQHVSEAIMRTLGSESVGYDAVVQGRPAPHREQLRSWDYGIFVKRDNLRLVKRNIDSSNYYAIKETRRLRELDDRVARALAEYLAYGADYADGRIALGEGKTIDHGEYLRNTLGFTQAMYDLWYAAADKLVYILEARLEMERTAQRRAMLVTVAGILLALAFFAYVTRGIVRSLKDIEDAMDRVANGELDLEVPHLEKGDEIGSMARTLERFRRSYWWLREE